jgi:hypothetical protein
MITPVSCIFSSGFTCPLSPGFHRSCRPFLDYFPTLQRTSFPLRRYGGTKWWFVFGFVLMRENSFNGATEPNVLPIKFAF